MRYAEFKESVDGILGAIMGKAGIDVSAPADTSSTLGGTGSMDDISGSNSSNYNINKDSKVPANVGAIKSYLSSKGLDSNKVAGIMANIKHESNFNPGAIGDGGTSGGLFQHHAGRFSAMKSACGSNWKTNWQGQIDFALSEPAGRQYTSMSFRSPEEATKWWTTKFEIPANAIKQASIRSQSASQFA